MIRVSEHFYSLQGEGPTTGVPSVFLRLQGCNFMCGGIGTEKDGELHNGAKWRCDTIEVWTKGKHYTNEELYELFLDNGYVNHLEWGAHLVVTGGEPLLQEDGIAQFIDYFVNRAKFMPFIEVETNASIVPKNLFSVVSQWNLSPKLASSGVTMDKRYVEDALTYFAGASRALHRNNPINITFKFVVSCEEDYQEIKEMFVDRFNINMDSLMLMPGGDTQELLSVTRPLVAEICKKYRHVFSDRMHISIWDKKTGV